MQNIKTELARIKTYLTICQTLPFEERIEFINEVKKMLHEISPFKSEPVDCVLWVKNDMIVANDYNPNSVAPPEMQLLELSIVNDGYTQPIVTWPKDEVTRDHYAKRFRTFINGWKSRGYDVLPDEAPLVLENAHWAPSWRRLCKVLLRNDWWCKGLGLTQPKSEAYDKFMQLKKIKKSKKEISEKKQLTLI